MRWTSLIFCSLTSSLAGALAAPTALQTQTLHLRSGAVAEWRQFEQIIPDGREIRLIFQAHSNPNPFTLLIAQDDVKLEWRVEMNKKRLGNLFLMEAPLQQTFLLPAGALREGENELTISPPKENDDIRVGPILLFTEPGPPDQTGLEISVTDTDDGSLMPARITIVTADGALAALVPASDQHLACRPGVVYTPTGRAKVQVWPGTYTIHATRGFEYGLARRSIHVSSGGAAAVTLSIRREVSTPGLISCDTHTHTFTFSRHGDATVAERVITLAGEGIELPIATDHNILTDYAEAAREMGVAQHLTPVIGDEVTTPRAHYNIFPIAPNSAVPDARQENWETLLKSMRETSGAQVVILNHPHNIHNDFEPFSSPRFQEILAHPEEPLGYDAIELINSSALQTDMWQVFKDWFALLSQGHHLVGVGASDVHDVSRYIVGQGRTYIRGPDADPGRIDVNMACRALKRGQALVSMGLLIDMKVNGQFQPGDVVQGLREPLEVEITVQAPSWIEANHVELYANGERVREAELQPTGQGGEKGRLKWILPTPQNKLFLVAIATGPPPTGLYWSIPRPYQPKGPDWKPMVMGCTNPIWINP